MIGQAGAPPGSALSDGMDRAMTRLLPRWPGWRNLPREARDTLFQLGVIAWTVAPHLLRLPAWCGLMVLAILLWRMRLAVGNAPLPNRWAIAGVLGVAVALTAWSQGTLLGKESGVTMLVVLMSLKMLELRARRDALVVFFLGFFLVLTHFLYSQSLAMALVTLGSVWGLLTALVLAHMPVGRPPIAQAGAVALRAALWALPLTAVLFVLFPRISPLWGVPQDAGGRTGLSGSLRMGGVTSLANDETIALRVRFLDGRTPPSDQLYFRGPVLAAFDGREWTRSGPRSALDLPQRVDMQLIGAPLRYEMTIEPSRMNLLPLLELTPAPEDGAVPLVEGNSATLRADLQWQLAQPITDRLRLQAIAWPIHRHGPRAPGLLPASLVQLPAGYNPRTLQWARDFRAADPALERADPRTLAAALYYHIGRGGFTYTLEPGGYGTHAVDEFWIDRKLGFCEHFSAAFVVIMRAWGVPARIVTGYQGADRDPVDGWYVVRNSHAHAWAEFWQPGEGWVRADPTAAVAPERIRRSAQLQPSRGIVAQALDTVDPELLQTLRRTWERFDNRWNQWVLNYSRGRQFDLLRELGFPSPSWTDLSYVLMLLLSLAAAIGAGWAWWDRQRQDPWTRLQARVQQRLADLGVAVGPEDPPRTRAARVRAELGAAGEPLAVALEALDRARYGRGGERRVDARWWRGFRSAAARMTTAPHAREAPT
jgi:transglutaminase-like putative cysteine protease